MRGRETEPTSIQGVDYKLPNRLVACGYGLTAGGFILLGKMVYDSLTRIDSLDPTHMILGFGAVAAGVIVGEVGFQIGVHRSGDRYLLT